MIKKTIEIEFDDEAEEKMKDASVALKTSVIFVKVLKDLISVVPVNNISIDGNKIWSKEK